MRPVLSCAMSLILSSGLTACYVVPERQADGQVIYQHYPLPPVGTVAPARVGVAPGGAAAPANLPVRRLSDLTTLPPPPASSPDRSPT